MDPVAALKCWPVEVDLAGQTYRIPSLPASAWTEALLSGDAFAVVPGLVDDADADQAVTAGLMTGELTTEDLVEAVKDAWEAASGWRWWEAYRLASAVTDPVVLGCLARDGFDFERRSFGALCAAVYSLAVANLDEEKRRRFDMDLSSPPVAELLEDEEAMADAFLIALGEKS